jgi:hypothetical protein
MEHWLPLFHDRHGNDLRLLPGSPVVLEPLDEDARASGSTRSRTITSARIRRCAARRRSAVSPLPPDRLYLPTPNGRSASNARRSCA